MPWIISRQKKFKSFKIANLHLLTFAFKSSIYSEWLFDSEVALDPSDINNISWLNADSFLQKLDNSVSYVQHFYMGY